MKKKMIDRTFEIVDYIEEREIEEKFLHELNCFYDDVLNTMDFPNNDLIKKIMSILNESIYNVKPIDLKSFIIGEIKGMVRVMDSLYKIAETEELVSLLKKDNNAINSLFAFYLKGENLIRNEIYDEDENFESLKLLEDNDLIDVTHFYDYKICSLSYKGEKIVKVIEDKDKRLINKTDNLYVEHSRMPTKNTIDFDVPKYISAIDEKVFNFSVKVRSKKINFDEDSDEYKFWGRNKWVKN